MISRLLHNPQNEAVDIVAGALGRPTQVQIHLCVHPVDSLVVPWLSLAPEQLATLPEPSAWASLDQRGQRRDDLRVSHRPVIGRPMKPCTGTGPRDR